MGEMEERMMGMQEISGIQVQLGRQRKGNIKLSLKEYQRDSALQSWSFEADGAAVRFWTEKREGCLIGRIEASLKTEAFRENDGFAMEAAVRLFLTLSQPPKRLTALYLYRDWWTRPAFLRDLETIPARTQCMYLDYGETFGCLYLMAGEKYKTMACGGTRDVLALEMTAYQPGLFTLKETVFVLSECEKPYDAIEAAGRMAAAQAKILTRQAKKLPEMFEYLGWCSWDAFYTDINGEKVRQKAGELEKKQVPVRWLLLDDGWLSVRENRLYDLAPEKAKFPEGFRMLTEQLKAIGQISWTGVWHALGGYWGGIEPGSRAALEEAKHLYETRSGKLLPAPQAEAGYGFYRDWYEYLRNQGIDFVKVDGQSAIKNYYANDIPVCQAARETHRALEGAAAAYMNGNLINCMGMGMENIMGRQGSALSRNSDDFVPDDPDGFAEHLIQNAYNAPYHDIFYYCDWDMYWTFHPDAQKHAVLRAVSGGPVYFSDRIGDTDRDAVMPLVYHDGHILRMDRAAKPSPDCLFGDPRREGAVKLTNLADCGIEGLKGGAVAVYNLTGKEVQTRVQSSDIHDLPAGEYFCYDRMRMKKAEDLGRIVLEKGGFSLYLFVPLKERTAVLGLTQKFISFHALEEVKHLDSGFLALVREAGEFAFYTEKRVKRILVNGTDRTLQLKGADGLYRITGTGRGRMLVQAVLE